MMMFIGIETLVTQLVIVIEGTTRGPCVIFAAFALFTLSLDDEYVCWHWNFSALRRGHLDTLL